MSIEHLKYPIGKFVSPKEITPTILEKWILDIESFPSRLKNEVIHLTEEQLDKEYRPDGWTIRQVIHHCADSHMNSFIRFKLTLTEDIPIIKPYKEDMWAELVDSKNMPIEYSLLILTGLHARWAGLLNSLKDQDLDREFMHPEQGCQIKLIDNIGIYAWHCEHHLAHITQLKNRNNWQ